MEQDVLLGDTDRDDQGIVAQRPETVETPDAVEPPRRKIVAGRMRLLLRQQAPALHALSGAILPPGPTRAGDAVEPDQRDDVARARRRIAVELGEVDGLHQHRDDAAERA